MVISIVVMVVVVVGTRTVAAAIPPSIPYSPILSPIFLKESTKMDRYQSGFGGMQLIIEMNLQMQGS